MSSDLSFGALAGRGILIVNQDAGTVACSVYDYLAKNHDTLLDDVRSVVGGFDQTVNDWCKNKVATTG